MSTRLARWYAAHPSIRRLWVIEEDSLLAAYIRLEPTSDGDDYLPIQLAMSRRWSGELQAITAREVHLRFLAPGDLPPACASADTAIIAAAGWRESWTDV